MLVITDIIPHVKTCLDAVPRLTFVPLEFPYKVRHNLQDDTDDGQRDGLSYEFEASSNFARSHWIGHILIQSSAFFSVLYQSMFEDTHLMGVVTHAFLAFAMTREMYCVYYNHLISRRFSSFLNELLRFETRWENKSSQDELLYWTNIEGKNLVKLGIRFNKTTIPTFSLFWAVSTAIWPLCPWRIIPAFVLNELSNMEDIIGHLSVDLLKRTLSFVFTYLGIYHNIGQFMIQTVLSSFGAQSSLFFMVLAWKRLISKSHHSQFPNSMDSVVRMFRETQLLCSSFNDIHKLHVNPQIILIGVTGLAMSLFMLVSSGESMNVQSALIFGDLMLITAAVIFLTFYFAVKVYEESKTVLMSKLFVVKHYGKFATVNGMKIQKAIRRYWRSFPVLKIFFFESNFFENGTPLVFFDFSIGCAINLILL